MLNDCAGRPRGVNEGSSENKSYENRLSTARRLCGLLTSRNYNDGISELVGSVSLRSGAALDRGLSYFVKILLRRRIEVLWLGLALPRI